MYEPRCCLAVPVLSGLIDVEEKVRELLKEEDTCNHSACDLYGKGVSES